MFKAAGGVVLLITTFNHCQRTTKIEKRTRKIQKKTTKIKKSTAKIHKYAEENVNYIEKNVKDTGKKFTGLVVLRDPWRQATLPRIHSQSVIKINIICDSPVNLQLMNQHNTWLRKSHG